MGCNRLSVCLQLGYAAPSGIKPIVVFITNPSQVGSFSVVATFKQKATCPRGVCSFRQSARPFIAISNRFHPACPKWLWGVLALLVPFFARPANGRSASRNGFWLGVVRGFCGRYSQKSCRANRSFCLAQASSGRWISRGKS